MTLTLIVFVTAFGGLSDSILVSSYILLLVFHNFTVYGVTTVIKKEMEAQDP